MAYQHPEDINLKNLHKSMEYNAAGQPVVRTTAGATASDAFGRHRISQPFTLFESSFHYKDSGEWSTGLVGNATAIHNANESVMDLTVTSDSGDSVIRETTRVFPYQPGKSLLILNSVVFATPQIDLRQRVGYFGANNGVYFENDGTVSKVCIRSQSLGTTMEVEQGSWNGDKLDGTGNSGRVLDLTKGNIFWVDLEWLGVGTVRTGFVFDGEFVVIHTFNNENTNSTTYMTTADLPIRYEITCANATIGNSTMKQICSSVSSEGGYEEKSKIWSATRTASIASANVATGWAPVLAIRLNTGREDAIVIPKSIQAVGTGNNAIYEYALIRNGNISGGAWTAHTSSGNNVQYNANATSITGGTVEKTGMFTSNNQSVAPIDEDIGYNFHMQLGRDLGPNSETLTLAVRHLEVGGNVYGSLSWFDFT